MYWKAVTDRALLRGGGHRDSGPVHTRIWSFFETEDLFARICGDRILNGFGDSQIHWFRVKWRPIRLKICGFRNLGIRVDGASKTHILHHNMFVCLLDIKHDQPSSYTKSLTSGSLVCIGRDDVKQTAWMTGPKTGRGWKGRKTRKGKGSHFFSRQSPLPFSVPRLRLRLKTKDTFEPKQPRSCIVFFFVSV